MKFTLSWLYEHLETDAGLDEICNKLNLIGLEVEEVLDAGARLAGFEVAEILATKPHPDADKLQICTVQSSQGTQDLICGAPNARAGLRGILAGIGAVIPANGMVIARAKIRGVESHGMLCSAAELELTDDDNNQDGIIELDKTHAIGTAAAQVLGQTECVIEIAITPNRPDCLGVRGIARDLAAAGLGALRPENHPPVQGRFDSPLAIKVMSPHCPIFAGRVVRGVKNGNSPAWLVRRLTAIGLRPINILADITNYISYDRGRPLHVYDVARLSGAVCARQGKKGESFTALDDNTYDVTPDDCVIADEKNVLGFGGVMGGLDSGCSHDTIDVLIESAWFDPIATANTGRRHNLESDARYRFERGVDPQSVETGLEQATRMVLELCGENCEASNVIIAGKAPAGTRDIAFDPLRVKALAGIDLATDKIIDILTRLGFGVNSGSANSSANSSERGGDKLKVTSPSWRPDVEGVADLVEEVVRIYGMDNVPSVALPRLHAVARPILTPLQKRTALARRVLAARGMVEAVTWSFIPQAHAKRFGGVAGLTLANPISVELATMRPSLVAGLLMAAGRNLDRGLSDFALFEVGQEFTAPEPGAQRIAASGVRQGNITARHWSNSSGKAETVSVFNAKADAESLLAAFGVNIDALQVKRDAPDWYHPGRSGVLCRDPRTPLAIFGEVHPEILQIFDLKGTFVAFEVYPENLSSPKTNSKTPPKTEQKTPSKTKGKTKSKSKGKITLSNLQAVTRDFAFEVAGTVEALSLVKAARGADKKLITAVTLFDAFEGGNMADGMKSLALEVTLQPFEATLTDEEIEAVSLKIIAAVEKASGGKLRG